MDSTTRSAISRGLQFQQAARLADFGLPLHLTDRYESLAVSRYGNVDGKATIA